MRSDPYRSTAALYDYCAGALGSSLSRTRMRLAPPIPGMKVLDVGCGTGADLQLYSQAGCTVYGVDLSPAMLKVAQKKLGDSATLRLCNAAQIPFPDEFFDLVLATYVLHEMPSENRPLAIREMMRVLKQDGRLLLMDFRPGPYRFPNGWISRALTLILEFVAGREHLRNGRAFLESGGLRELLSHYSLKTERSAIVNHGNVELLLLAPC